MIKLVVAQRMVGWRDLPDAAHAQSYRGLLLHWVARERTLVAGVVFTGEMDEEIAA